MYPFQDPTYLSRLPISLVDIDLQVKFRWIWISKLESHVSILQTTIREKYNFLGTDRQLCMQYWTTNRYLNRSTNYNLHCNLVLRKVKDAIRTHRDIDSGRSWLNTQIWWRWISTRAIPNYCLGQRLGTMRTPRRYYWKQGGGSEQQPANVVA